MQTIREKGVKAGNLQINILYEAWEGERPGEIDKYKDLWARRKNKKIRGQIKKIILKKLKFQLFLLKL